MQTFDKIYQPNLGALPVGESMLPKLKNFFCRFLPLILKFSAAACVLLILQIMAIGILDRSGISPKTAFLYSSLFYVVGLGLLFFIGSIKTSENEVEIDKIFKATNIGPPVCKILTIRKK